MNTLETTYTGCMPVVNVGGVLLAVERDIDYVTVDVNGLVQGWLEARPYFDGDEKTWSSFELYGRQVLLAKFSTPVTNEAIETLIEVYA
ncbi:hypothetical protein NVP1081O_065 [Vibrio phage 1.081.O._10N.286.52.C2]|nr:hypothetical protein NVP1081O_065 [Vibrio phage 1.081.O._10N.286.52.C2]